MPTFKVILTLIPGDINDQIYQCLAQSRYRWPPLFSELLSPAYKLANPVSL